MVQHFTELGLEMRSARISSDGGWFVDSFEIQEADGTQVTNARKLESIRRVRDCCLQLMFGLAMSPVDVLTPARVQMLDVYNVEDESVADAGACC